MCICMTTMDRVLGWEDGADVMGRCRGEGWCGEMIGWEVRLDFEQVDGGDREHFLYRHDYRQLRNFPVLSGFAKLRCD